MNRSTPSFLCIFFPSLPVPRLSPRFVDHHGRHVQVTRTTPDNDRCRALAKGAVGARKIVTRRAIELKGAFDERPISAGRRDISERRTGVGRWCSDLSTLKTHAQAVRTDRAPPRCERQPLHAYRAYRTGQLSSGDRTHLHRSCSLHYASSRSSAPAHGSRRPRRVFTTITG